MTRVVSLLFLFVMACSADDPAALPEVTDYFPLRRGIYHIYQVDSTVISQDIETSYSYELKLEVTDSFPNAEGGYTYVVRRSKRIAPLESWELLNPWSLRVTAIEAVVNEGNTPYRKLVGPLGEGKSWDGNALNNLGGSEKCVNGDQYTCDVYTVTNFGDNYETAGITAGQALTVVENDNNDLIVSQDKRSEVYGKDIGLLEKSILKLDFCTDPDCVGEQFVEQGLNYRQLLIEYGGI